MSSCKDYIQLSDLTHALATHEKFRDTPLKLSPHRCVLMSLISSRTLFTKQLLLTPYCLQPNHQPFHPQQLFGRTWKDMSVEVK